MELEWQSSEHGVNEWDSNQWVWCFTQELAQHGIYFGLNNEKSGCSLKSTTTIGLQGSRWPNTATPSS